MAGGVGYSNNISKHMSCFPANQIEGFHVAQLGLPEEEGTLPTPPTKGIIALKNIILSQFPL